MNQVLQQGGEGALVAWDPNSGAALPAYMTTALGELGTNIPDRNMVPSLSYEGKTWTIVKDGNKTKLQTKDADGDTIPISVMRLVVLKFNPDRGRAYYEGAYNPAAVSAPKCWSPDGKAPDASVKEKQATTCQSCPMSVKGSKVDDGGREMVACSSHRMVAVAPAFELAADPLRLKIAVTSDYDKEVVEHGWFAFRQYVDYLKSRGITHTGLVVTKVKFDPTPAYPKLLFALDRLLSQDEVAQILQACANPKVDELLAEKWTVAGSAGTPIDDSDIKPHGLEGAYADGWQAHPDAAGYSWKGAECVTNEELAARYPKPEPVIPPVPASEQVVEHVPASPEPAPEQQPVGAVWNPIEKAEADGWIKHPDAPDYHYKGATVTLSTEVAAMYPAPAAAPAAPAAPPAPPAPPPSPEKTPREKAEADGWALHPTAPDYLWKGEEVVLIADVEARYAGNAQTGASSAASADTGAAGATGPTATTAASLSEVPADVQSLLEKWTGG